MRRALKLMKRASCPFILTSAFGSTIWRNLLQATNHFAEAELMMRRALKIDEASFGPFHPAVARDLNNLALFLEDRGSWAASNPFRVRVKKIVTSVQGITGLDHSRFGKAVLTRNADSFRASTRALYRAGETDTANRAEGSKPRNGRCKTGRRMRSLQWRPASPVEIVNWQYLCENNRICWLPVMPPIAVSMLPRGEPTPRSRMPASNHNGD